MLLFFILLAIIFKDYKEGNRWMDGIMANLKSRGLRY